MIFSASKHLITRHFKSYVTVLPEAAEPPIRGRGRTRAIDTNPFIFPILDQRFGALQPGALATPSEER